jgi:hypothetical protein
MQSLLLIYGNEEHFGKLTETEQQGVIEEYTEFPTRQRTFGAAMSYPR